jgi:hypothetical protein
VLGEPANLADGVPVLLTLVAHHAERRALTRAPKVVRPRRPGSPERSPRWRTGEGRNGAQALANWHEWWRALHSRKHGPCYTADVRERMAAEISWASNIRKPHSSITCRGLSKPQPS